MLYKSLKLIYFKNKITVLFYFLSLFLLSRISPQSMREEMQQNGHRLQYMDKAGAYLVQKSDPDDSAQIQRDLDHFQKVLEQVLTRLNKVNAKLQQQAATGQVCISKLRCHALVD